jgi:hypothetical protein
MIEGKVEINKAQRRFTSTIVVFFHFTNTRASISVHQITIITCFIQPKHTITTQCSTLLSVIVPGHGVSITYAAFITSSAYVGIYIAYPPIIIHITHNTSIITSTLQASSDDGRTMIAPFIIDV